MKKLSIVIVNFQSEKYISKCLDSIKKQSLKVPVQVIIVNADDSNYKINLNGFSRASLIINLDKNLGFGHGVNEGVKYAIGDYLLILNPDVVLKDGLVNALDIAIKNNFIVGANLFLPNGDMQPYAFGDFHSLKTILLNKRNSKCSKYDNKYINKKTTPLSTNINKFNWVSGTAMLLKKDLFLKLNGFDESYFMYFEDQDLCFRAKMLGVSIVVIKEFKIIHFGGKSFDKKPAQLKEYNKSLYLFLKKNGNFLSYMVIVLLKPIYDYFKNK